MQQRKCPNCSASVPTHLQQCPFCSTYFESPKRQSGDVHVGDITYGNKVTAIYNNGQGAIIIGGKIISPLRQDIRNRLLALKNKALHKSRKANPDQLAHCLLWIDRAFNDLESDHLSALLESLSVVKTIMETDDGLRGYDLLAELLDIVSATLTLWGQYNPEYDQ